jgi:hypothetical protein
MSFTTVPTFTPGQVITATDLNTYLRDNEGYLLNRPSQIILRDNNANYTNSVTGSFANIDGTNLAITLNFSGSLAYVWLQGVASGSVAGVIIDFDFTLDGTRVGAGGANGLYNFRSPGTNGVGGIYYAALVAITPGSHTLKPVWSPQTGTATLYSGANSAGTDYLVQFGVMEVA